LNAHVRLAAVGDVHESEEALERALWRIDDLACDGLLLTGDLGVPDRVLEVVDRHDPDYLWVPGNHDVPGNDHARNVDHRMARLGGLRVVGIGGSGPEHFGFPYEWEEVEIRRLVLPPADVLLSHSPPARTRIDTTARGVHAGSEAVRELALRHEGVLVCGHIHEASGIERLGQCLCVNVGSLGAPWAANRVALIDWGETTVAVSLLDLDREERREDSLLLRRR